MDPSGGYIAAATRPPRRPRVAQTKIDAVSRRMSKKTSAAHLSVALVVAQLLCMGVSAAAEARQLIWGSIPFVKGANYYEFNAELSKTRAEARAEPLGELASLLIPLASSSDDVARLAQVMAGSVMKFDDLVR